MIVPIVAIPLSMIGAFFVMFLMGFSINLLTLLAMVLAIGLVVDDAIVVLENIYRQVEKLLRREFRVPESYFNDFDFSGCLYLNQHKIVINCTFETVHSKYIDECI